MLNRGYHIYLASGGWPPGRYFHAINLLGLFHAPSADPLGETLAGRPDCIVLAGPRVRYAREHSDAFSRIVRTPEADYIPEGSANGDCGRFLVDQCRDPQMAEAQEAQDPAGVKTSRRWR